MKNKKGFTLIELLIAAMIFSVVVTLAGTLFVSGFRNYEKVSSLMTGQANTRYVMYEISKELRNAEISEIAINDTKTSITIGSVSFTYSSAGSSISKSASGITTVIARDISFFSVELIEDTIFYSIQASGDTAQLNSSITLIEFDRPSRN